MTDKERINQLVDRLESLVKRQDDFSKEINSLRTELNRLKIAEVEQQAEQEPSKVSASIIDVALEIKKEKLDTAYQTASQKATKETPPPPIVPVNQPQKPKSDIERFVGENLINKIGIAITVIGVAIGAKYAIDHQLVSPLTRIILGYLAGIGLLGFAIVLKKNYENFSAVLLSGAMAVMYFITYSAYGLYDLIPQVAAFVLMVVFTAFTVVAALNYNRQVIAHIGLVGAYAVPFLLSDGSGKVGILFSYMAIINVGILAIAFKKYWKPLYYSSFGLTWLIYLVWYVFDYQTEKHFGLALVFLSIFFVTFYLLFLGYKLLQKEKFAFDDIVLLLANTFLFYGIGFAILDNHTTGEQLLGLFTLCNALVHFSVGVIIYKQKLADRNLFYLVVGLVLIFITATIPVQLDGNWVTILWAGEAALLFWIGRTKNATVYENLSYPLMLLALSSIVHDWTSYGYNPENPEARILPLINVNFLSSALFIAAFGFITILSRNKSYHSESNTDMRTSKTVAYLAPAILLFVIYYAFRIEIASYWEQRYLDSALTVNSEYYWNEDLRSFKIIWIITYSLLFVSVLSIVNLKKLRNQPLGLINLALIAVALAAFLIQGLYVLSELRESYLAQELSQYYQRGIFNIVIRYISFSLVALALLACYKYIQQDFLQKDLKLPFDFLLHTTVLWTASSELINWMDIAESAQSYKLGLSILWGVYSLAMIALGIWKKKKYLRIWAIALFGVTLAKLFFYDISHLDTIAKTIVFVTLGILLLIISFLYNKFKHTISDGLEE